MRDSERVLGAGVGTNLVVGAVSLLLLIGVVSAMTPINNGVLVQSVYAQSPANTYGIQSGDFITAVNGVPVNGPQSIQNSSWYKPGGVINMTILRDGKTIQLYDVKLNKTGLLLGIVDVDLKGLVSNYAGSFFKNPVLYVCIPALPFCQTEVPFSDTMARYYTSPVGPWLSDIANLLYWLFFLDFSLAIFNALPIGPFDGGQAFGIGVKALAKGRLSDRGIQRITLGTSLVILAVLLLVILGPYAGLF